MVHMYKRIISPGVFFHFSEVLIFSVTGRVKKQKMAQNNKKVVCHILYLTKHKSYDHDFWHTCVNWWHLQYFFYFFRILIFQVVRGVKGQKMVQNDKKFYLAQSWLMLTTVLILLWFLVHVFKTMKSSASFFIFRILIFFIFRGIKGQKMTQNYQFQSATLSISGL